MIKAHDEQSSFDVPLKGGSSPYAALPWDERDMDIATCLKDMTLLSSPGEDSAIKPERSVVIADQANDPHETEDISMDLTRCAGEGIRDKTWQGGYIWSPGFKMAIASSASPCRSFHDPFESEDSTDRTRCEGGFDQQGWQGCDILSPRLMAFVSSPEPEGEPVVDQSSFTVPLEASPDSPEPEVSMEITRCVGGGILGGTWQGIDILLPKLMVEPLVPSSPSCYTSEPDIADEHLSIMSADLPSLEEFMSLIGVDEFVTVIASSARRQEVPSTLARKELEWTGSQKVELQAKIDADEAVLVTHNEESATHGVFVVEEYMHDTLEIQAQTRQDFATTKQAYEVRAETEYYDWKADSMLCFGRLLDEDATRQAYENICRTQQTLNVVERGLQAHADDLLEKIEAKRLQHSLDEAALTERRRKLVQVNSASGDICIEMDGLEAQLKDLKAEEQRLMDERNRRTLAMHGWEPYGNEWSYHMRVMVYDEAIQTTFERRGGDKWTVSGCRVIRDRHAHHRASMTMTPSPYELDQRLLNRLIRRLDDTQGGTMHDAMVIIEHYAARITTFWTDMYRAAFSRRVGIDNDEVKITFVEYSCPLEFTVRLDLIDLIACQLTVLGTDTQRGDPKYVQDLVSRAVVDSERTPSILNGLCRGIDTLLAPG